MTMFILDSARLAAEDTLLDQVDHGGQSASV